MSRFKLPNKMDKFIKRKNSIDDNESEIKRSRAANSCDKAPKARPKRQYCDDYLKYGFHLAGSEDQPFPLCVICGEKMLFLRTRGKTRLILRSQVFEIQIVLDQKDLLGVSKCV